MMTAPHAFPVRAQAPVRRQVSSTTVLWGILMLFALGGAGLFLSESVKHGRSVAWAQTETEKSQDKLAAFEFENGSLKDPKQRMDLDFAILEAQQNAKHMRDMAAIQEQETLIAAGAFVAALVFGALAFRSTRVRVGA